MKNYKLKNYILFQTFIFIFSVIVFSINNNLSFNISVIFDHIFNKEIDLKDLGFFYTELIKNYFNFKIFYLTLDSTQLFVGRPLFIAIFLTIIIKIVSLEFFIIFIKNSIFFTIYYISVNEYFSKFNFNKYKFFLILCAPFIIPYNLYQSFQLSPEESYLIFLIPSIFLCIISKSEKKIFVTLLFIITLFTKSPNVILITSLIILIYTKYFKIKFRNLIFSSFVIASLLWGSYGYYKSQIFTFFHKSYTVNSFTGLQSHNMFFKYFYPEYSVDEITKYFKFFEQKPVDRSEKNYEKILSYEKKKFIKENFFEYINNKIIILRHIFFNIKKDGSLFTKKCNNTFDKIITRMQQDKNFYMMQQKERDQMIACKKDNSNKIRLDFLINKILWFCSIIISLLNLSCYKKKIKLSILFLYMNFFYLIPFIYGHAYTRHLIILFVLSIITLILNFPTSKRKKL